MTKRIKVVIFLFFFAIVVLSTSSCGDTSNHPFSVVCTKDEMQVSTSLEEGLVFRMNHCLVRDVVGYSEVATFIAGIVANDCPNLPCKAVASAIAGFMITQKSVLQDVDNQCKGQGAVLIIGSFTDKVLWKIEPICNTHLGHLIVVDKKQSTKGHFQCDAIYLTFTLRNTGEQAMKWHLATYYENTNISPPNLIAFMGAGEHIRTGRKAGTYDEEGIIPGQEITVIVTGSVDPHQIRKYKRITLSFLGDKGDNDNPSSLPITCS